jgi:hypothetical protein
MTDKTDDTGKGPSRPGDPPKRPYATIDLQATEVGRERGQPAAEAWPKAEAGAQSSSVWAGLLAAWGVLAAGLVAAGRWMIGLARSNTFLSHLSAGVAGAALVLVASALAWLLAGGGGERVPADLGKRLAVVEKALPQRSTLPEEAKARFSAIETRLAKADERVQAMQAKVAADMEAMKERSAVPDLTERVAKLEAALPSRAEGDAGEARTAAARTESELAALKAEAQGLRRGLEALKGSMDERLKETAKAADLAPVLSRLGAYQRDLDAVLKTEDARTSSSRQVLLTLELANLKRALDRGDSYTGELEAVRRAASGEVDLAPLERSSRTGVPTLNTLTQEFRRVANAAADAESEKPDASVLDRLIAGAKSVVRLRKASHDVDDTSAEATLGRMESALKEGRIDEVLAQGRRLPPKAAAAAGDWLKKLEARTAADRAVAAIEAGLKASLAPQRGPEPKR